MTQILHLSAKEMTRRTGINNALGYTYPEKDLILLKKGLTGKKKREVLDHEINHLRKGEEGPFLGGLLGKGVGIGMSALGGMARSGGFRKGMANLGEQYQEGREDLGPYRRFGREQMEGPGGLSEWAKTGFQAPTMEQARERPGYQSRFNALENTAAARGGLMSGNALIEAADFGGREYESEYNRQQREYQNELAKRMGFANLGYGAASRSAGLGETYGGRMADLQVKKGQSGSDMWGDIGGSLKSVGF